MVYAGIILAGGHSKRMGRDKALMARPGMLQETFVGYLATLLTPLCSEVLLVARDEKQASRYTKSLDIHIITDRVSDVGPLMGLYSGLSAIQASHALVTAVDMPFVQPAMVNFLFAHVQEEALLVPVVNGVPQVLLAVYPRTILPLIEERLQAGRRDPRSLLEVAPVCFIEEAQLRAIDPQLRSFANINTPQDLDSYKSIYDT